MWAANEALALGRGGVTLVYEATGLSHQTIAWGIQVDLGFSLQANRRTQEGADHPDRDAQFALRQIESEFGLFPR